MGAYVSETCIVLNLDIQEKYNDLIIKELILLDRNFFYANIKNKSIPGGILYIFFSGSTSYESDEDKYNTFLKSKKFYKPNEQIYDFDPFTMDNSIKI